MTRGASHKNSPTKLVTEVPIDALKDAIRDLHGCDSTWAEAVPVKETFKGHTVWEGVVQVFDLTGHPAATRCYAWSHAVDYSGKRRFVAVLHEDPVNSPATAVRAAIVKEQLDK